MGEVREITPITLEEIDNKVAKVFDCLYDLYNVPGCLADLDVALKDLPFPWIKFCLQSYFVHLANDKGNLVKGEKI